MLVIVQVKVLYVRNLKSDVTEDQLREKFEQHGKVERVKKVKDYGFIHFEDRESAMHAMELLNGTVCFSVYLCVCLPVCLSTCVCLPVCLSTCMSVCLYVCLPVCLSACMSVYLCVCLPVCLSACICVFVHISVSTVVQSDVRFQCLL